MAPFFRNDYNKDIGRGQGKEMVKEIKTSTLTEAEVLKVIALFSKEIRKTGLGEYFEEEFVRERTERHGEAFWIFDGPHEDDFAKVLEEKIREVEIRRDNNLEKEQLKTKVVIPKLLL
jgi:hypothetical protein